MRFSLTEEQVSFAGAIDGVLGSADVAGVCRLWASGDTSDGIRLWGRLAELGVTGLRVPDEFGGTDGTPLDLAVACERLGYHGVPGPYLESVALAPALPVDAAVLTELAKGTARVSVAAPPHSPYAVDAATATHRYLLTGRTLFAARVDHTVESVDPTRRLALLAPGEIVGVVSERALDEVVLATAAWLVGAGQRLLDDTVTYVTARRQFGRPIGEFQAVKHALADVKVALDFARPLLHGAAHAVNASAHGVAGREVSAAKVLASQAAHRAARTALQLHGAVGYTQELDLSRWILRVRALIGAWGTPAYHRARVLDSLVGS
ncbi:acyl-CoA dehydrogenase family protein [Cryptosporangium sp. NPDC048952]|uniref:acyl-CoA dehydrogenase family protein n=1 Tax=Cryptosporangium sp. NPDC048952 TaxID=3363961 RepID=UPI00371E44F7